MLCDRWDPSVNGSPHLEACAPSPAGSAPDLQLASPEWERGHPRTACCNRPNSIPSGNCEFLSSLERLPKIACCRQIPWQGRDNWRMRLCYLQTALGRNKVFGPMQSSQRLLGYPPEMQLR